MTMISKLQFSHFHVLFRRSYGKPLIYIQGNCLLNSFEIMSFHIGLLPCLKLSEHKSQHKEGFIKQLNDQ